MLGNKQGRARAGTSWGKGVRGKGTHDIGMIETLERPHLAPHALLFRNRLQCDLARDIPSCRLGGGTLRGREGERGSGERAGVVEGGGMDGSTARRSARVHCSGGTRHVARCHM